MGSPSEEFELASVSAVDILAIRQTLSEGAQNIESVQEM